ncbi:MAG TPA: hypothetical protein VET85_04870 [Stellaceae bacterium]|nr:hypothetical protein [Stellaceae bacterium]
MAVRQGLGAATAMLAVAVSALAQTGGPSPPPRIANHYNHKAYQPTEADVCAREKSIAACADAAHKDQDQLDAVKRQLDELQKKYPPGALTNERR